jgi:hypothetical protein
MKKRVLSVLLTAVLSAGLFSTTVFADEAVISADQEIMAESQETQIESAEDALEAGSEFEAIVINEGTDTDGEYAFLDKLPPEIKDVADEIIKLCDNLKNAGYPDKAKDLLEQLKKVCEDNKENFELPDLTPLKEALDKVPTDLSEYKEEGIQALTDIVITVLDKMENVNLSQEDIDQLADMVKEGLSGLSDKAEHPVAVILNKMVAVLTIGEKVQLKATVLPTSAEDKSVTWKSSDTSVATVDTAGLVKAKSVGYTTITVTTNDGDKKAYCGIFVYQPVADLKITLSPESAAYTGKEIKPTVTVKCGTTTLEQDKDYKVKYSKNINAGTATVKITGKGYYTGSVKVPFTITKAANTVTVKKTSYSYKQSKLTAAKTFTISVSKAIGNVTFTRDSNAKKAGIKVSSTGKVTVPKNCKKGTYVITVKASGDSNYKSKKIKVTITVK